MAITAGALSQVSVESTKASLLSAVATGGATPYSYQWYKSVTSGFSPGSGNAISGATALALNQTGLIPGTQYYYKVVAIDSAGTPLSASATQLGVLTTQPVMSQNAFAMVALLGMLDLRFNFDTISAEIDSSETGTLYPGQAVKIVFTAGGGIPKVVKCSANSDEVFGFINYDIKSQNFVAGDRCELSQSGNVMFMYATGAIGRGAQVTLDVTTVGGVAEKVGSSGARIVGFAYDEAEALGALIRVKVSVPSYAVA